MLEGPTSPSSEVPAGTSEVPRILFESKRMAKSRSRESRSTGPFATTRAELPKAGDFGLRPLKVQFRVEASIKLTELGEPAHPSVLLAGLARRDVSLSSLW